MGGRSTAREQELAFAYARVSKRLERLTNGAWNNSAAIDVLRPSEFSQTEILGMASGFDVPDMKLIRGPGGLVRVSPKRNEGTVRVGIATMKGREDGLREVLSRLAPQADEVFVYLNDFDSLPDDVDNHKNVSFYTGKDFGDRAKFIFLRNFDGYYLTADDDILYPPYYVDSIVNGIEKYSRKAVVGWHGSIFKKEFEDYYSSSSRQVLSFSKLRGVDTPVHLLGTGIAGFHTGTIDVDFDEFYYANMADAFLAIASKRQKVPMVVLAHDTGWARPIEPDAPSISRVSMGRASADGLDVAQSVSSLISQNGPWETPRLPSTSRNLSPLPTIAIIGRTDKGRWKKGGIVKSTHLTRDALARLGVRVHLEDIETGDPYELSGAKTKSVLVYVGDPERPDYARAEGLILHHLSQGRSVLANLSVNLKGQRFDLVVRKILAWHSEYPGMIRLMVFSESIRDSDELSSIRDLVMVFPKTLAYEHVEESVFHERSGVFVGDIAKLSDPDLLENSASEWIEAIRSALPGVPLLAVEQYKPRYKIDFKVDEVWPYTATDFEARLNRARLMVTPVRYATFEMVPLEAAALGVPVVYTSMPQSLSEYISFSGLRIDGPEELAGVLPDLYWNYGVWSSMSRASEMKSESQEISLTAGNMYLRIIQLNALSKV